MERSYVNENSGTGSEVVVLGKDWVCMQAFKPAHQTNCVGIIHSVPDKMEKKTVCSLIVNLQKPLK